MVSTDGSLSVLRLWLREGWGNTNQYLLLTSACLRLRRGGARLGARPQPEDNRTNQEEETRPEVGEIWLGLLLGPEAQGLADGCRASRRNPFPCSDAFFPPGVEVIQVDPGLHVCDRRGQPSGSS
ncbi:hypothetical protein [Candidatus Methylacidithermus pantelleriae]|nr:hypothetical protein [Candidatus Methylacidithermus pantelleriae]